jgi:hypothetical protein
MAYSYGDSATKFLTPSAANIVDGGTARGNVHCFVDTYTGTTAEAGDELTVFMGPELPVGARVLYVGIQCPVTGITINVGDLEDADRYISAAAASQASYVDNVLAGLGYEVDMTTAATPDNQVTMTLSAACAAVQVRLIVMYSYD